MSKKPIAIHRCSWAENDPLMSKYHDEEWGVPERDSRALWEALMLDGFQAGLSWMTILRKREAFRKAFRNFDPKKVARMGEDDIAGFFRMKASFVPAPRSKRPSTAHVSMSPWRTPVKISRHGSGRWRATSRFRTAAQSPQRRRSLKRSLQRSRNAASSSSVRSSSMRGCRRLASSMTTALPCFRRKAV